MRSICMNRGNKKKPNFSNLPNEVLRRIASFLPKEGIKPALGKINAKFIYGRLPRTKKNLNFYTRYQLYNTPLHPLTQRTKSEFRKQVRKAGLESKLSRMQLAQRQGVGVDYHFLNKISHPLNTKLAPQFYAYMKGPQVAFNSKGGFFFTKHHNSPPSSPASSRGSSNRSSPQYSPSTPNSAHPSPQYNPSSPNYNSNSTGDTINNSTYNVQTHFKIKPIDHERRPGTRNNFMRASKSAKAALHPGGKKTKNKKNKKK